MKAVKTGMAGLNESERLVRAQDVVTHLTGNAFFPTVNPPLATVQAHIDDATAKMAAVAAAITASRMAIQQRRAAMELLDNDIVLLATDIANIADGDEEKILSSGFMLRTPSTPPALPTAPQNVKVFAGEFPGEFVVRWEGSDDAVIYYLETTNDPNTPSSWVRRGSSTRTNATLSGLPTGGYCWVRVAGDGPAGQGPWSDPAAKTVP
jgi:hypothetical protein